MPVVRIPRIRDTELCYLLLAVLFACLRLVTNDLQRSSNRAYKHVRPADGSILHGHNPSICTEHFFIRAMYGLCLPMLAMDHRNNDDVGKTCLILFF
jgi:hypothetical protein